MLWLLTTIHIQQFSVGHHLCWKYVCNEREAFITGKKEIFYLAL